MSRLERTRDDVRIQGLDDLCAEGAEEVDPDLEGVERGGRADTLEGELGEE